MKIANHYLGEAHMPAFNAEFARPARVEESAFVRMSQPEALEDILCGLHERVVGKDNCVSFEGRVLQLQPPKERPHYMRVRVKARRHMDGSLSVWHGPRLLRRYGADGRPRSQSLAEAAWDGPPRRPSRATPAKGESSPPKRTG